MLVWLESTAFLPTFGRDLWSELRGWR